MILVFILLLLPFLISLHADEQYQIGIINHNTQWYIHCLQNDTRVLTPPLTDQTFIPYQCPYSLSSIDILPLEIDFTFVCRLQARLIWFIIDLYQYNIWSWSITPEQLNISVTLNHQIPIKNSKNEINKYENRFILINAFYIPFESLNNVAHEYIDIFVQINQCRFYMHDNSTWNHIFHICDSIESKTLTVRYALCDIFPTLKPIETARDLEEEEEPIDERSTTNIPDYHVVLSVDEEKSMETTTAIQIYDYHMLSDEHYRKMLTSLRSTENLIIYMFIFTLTILILLIIFFIYTLCYHHYKRTIQKTTTILI